MERIHLLQNHRYFNGANFTLTQYSCIHWIAVVLRARTFGSFCAFGLVSKTCVYLCFGPLSVSILSISCFQSLRAAVFWAKFSTAVFCHRHCQDLMCKCRWMWKNERTIYSLKLPSPSVWGGYRSKCPRLKTCKFLYKRRPKFMFSFLITFFVSFAFEKTKRGPHDTNENRLPKGPRVGRCRCWLLKDASVYIYLVGGQVSGNIFSLDV